MKVLEAINAGRFSIKKSTLKFNITAESSIINWQFAYEKSGVLGLENKLRGELFLENKRLCAEITVLKS